MFPYHLCSFHLACIHYTVYFLFCQFDSSGALRKTKSLSLLIGGHIIEVLMCILFYLTVLGEFCRISLEFIRNGINPKVYHSAAGNFILTFDLFVNF